MDQSQQLGNAKIPRLLLEFSIPAVVGMLVTSLYSIVNRMFIGNSEGTLGIAGITVGFPLMLLIMAFAMLVGVGANALVSIKLGEGKKEDAEKILGNAITLLIIISVAITVLGLIFLKPLLITFGASSDVLPYAASYMRIILWGTLIQILGFGLNNFIRGEGNPKVAMNTMLIGAAINIVFCPLFIFVFGWGIEGSALATIVGQTVSTFFVLRYFLSGKSTLKIRRENLKLRKSLVNQILALGSAQFAMQFAAVVVITILNWRLGTYGGDMAISGMGIVAALQTLVLMPLFGINQGVQPIIGYNHGAMKYDRVKEALKLAIKVASVIALIGYAIIQIFPRPLVTLFNSTDTQFIEFSVYALRVYLLMLPIIGFQVVGSGYFMSVGKPRQSAFLSLSRQVLLFIPAIIILPLFFGLHGVIIAGPVADLISSMLTGVWLVKELRHLEDKHQVNRREALRRIPEPS